VVPGFLRQRQSGVLKLTDERMTRFWITLEQSVAFVAKSIKMMQGGEIFVPKLPSMRLMDLAQAVAPECKIEFIGIRPGEKLHETLISEDEARRTIESEDNFVVQPYSMAVSAATAKEDMSRSGNPVAHDFQYVSNNNSDWMSIDELKTIITKLMLPPRFGPLGNA
jgi:UDP-N-acetylglucosamine 4,6-dehydratase